ncbi:MAG: hypothetical protein JWP87_4967, partial [Labilithrix sp.]|nr:hypothetical protein [Labilithrix sp.]
FSDAALHARGMNLLVLINLIMACILGIRVALRTAKIVLVIASAVFAALGFVSPPLFAASGATSAAAAVLQNVGSALDRGIDGALTGLNEAQDLIAKSTPTLAKAAATKSVGDLYKPNVASVATMELAGPLSSLPVEHTDPRVLCKNAAASLPLIGAWLLSKTPLGAFTGEPLKFIGEIMKTLAGADTDGFCGLQSNGGGGNGGAGGNGGGNNSKTAPAIDRTFDENAARICQDLNGGDSARQAFEDKEKEWLAECAKAGVTCQSRDPQTGAPLKSGTQNGRTSLVRADGQDEQFALDELRLERDQDLRTFDALALHLAEFELNPAKCIAFEKADLKRRHAEQQQLQQSQPQKVPPQAPQNNGGQNNGGSSSSSTTASMAVVRAWHNGVTEAQIIGGAKGDDAVLQRSASLVRVATVPKRTPQVSSPEAAAVPALAQAEFFYDCGGTWAVCNSEEEAMWHFKWRARLRRFKQSFDATQQEIAPQVGAAPPRTGPDAFADQLAQDALGNNTFDPNAALRHDLANSLRDQRTRTQGVH